MIKEQEDVFWKIIRILDELKILSHIMIIGSWAEYLYKDLSETEFIPNPAVYVIQKILTNPIREPFEKKEKDMAAVRELLYHINQSKVHSAKYQEVLETLTKKQLKILDSVKTDYNLDIVRI